MIHVTCPSCRAVLAVAPGLAGKKVLCSGCGQKLLIPAPAANRTVLAEPIKQAIAAPSPIPPHQERSINFEGAPEPQPAPIITQPTPPARGYWRPVAPAFFLLASVCFFLPLVDVRCSTDGPQGGKSLATQSGFEAACGTATPNPMMVAAAGPQAQEARQPQPFSPSPWMCLYPAPLMLGVLFGLCAPSGRSRCAVVALLAAAALGLLAAQTIVGFPIDTTIKQAIAESAAEEAAKNQGADAFAAMLSASMFEVVYTPWLWLSFAAGTGAMLAASMEWAVRRQERPVSVGRRQGVWTAGLAAAAAVVMALAGGGAWAVLTVKAAWVSGAAPWAGRPLPTWAQKIAWRHKASAYDGGRVVAAWDGDAVKWRMLSQANGRDEWRHQLPVVERRDGTQVIDSKPLKLEMDEACRKARKAVEDGKTPAAAVLDLSSSESPAVALWYYREGMKVVEGRDAPTPEMSHGMADLLYDMQVNAGRY